MFIYKLIVFFFLLQPRQRLIDAPIASDSETTMPVFFQNARDSLGFYNEIFKPQSPQQSKTNTEARKIKLKGGRSRNDVSKKFIKSRVPHQSFVINSAPHKGIRLIKIQVLDLERDQLISDCIHDDKVLLTSQYVVKDVGDEIMDQTEDIISAISKKICNYSYTNWF